MKQLFSTINTAWALGISNVISAALYRISVKFRYERGGVTRSNLPLPPFFYPTTLSPLEVPSTTDWQESALLFSIWPIQINSAPPDWNKNYISGVKLSDLHKPWWEIPDFDPAVGDIKVIWELSRMDWVLALAQRHRQGDENSYLLLNEWISDWICKNPPYRGLNWKCGQEASIRVINLAVAAMILGQVRAPAAGLIDLITLHLRRIAPTIVYAESQNNNHITSEATALFIGGNWLKNLGIKEGDYWARVGRKYLEKSVNLLIGNQGSFSQYSLNYHRMMLDTLCIAETFRIYFALPSFTTHWSERAYFATQWLHHMITSQNGDGPNIGANDGSRLLKLTNASYRDFRPTVQLAMVLFANKRAFDYESSDSILHWLDINVPENKSDPPGDYFADDGGFIVMRRNNCSVLLRYPRFKFRPSQADALHLDMWVDNVNVLRDGGTYSYNDDAKLMNYFSGTESHNTVQFDQRNQMRKISRFLFADWLTTTDISPPYKDDQATFFTVGYVDAEGAKHTRSLKLTDNLLCVTDNLSGFKKQAILRWRLAPGDWCIENVENELMVFNKKNRGFIICINSTATITRCELINGFESLYYFDKTIIPVLEIEIINSGIITSQIKYRT
jgi:hypothetical protein